MHGQGRLAAGGGAAAAWSQHGWSRAVPLEACGTACMPLHAPPIWACLPCCPMQLILADEDMAIDVGSIMVSGALRAGGPDCRLASRITLTFRPQSGVDLYNMVGGGRVWCFSAMGQHVGAVRSLVQSRWPAHVRAGGHSMAAPACAAAARRQQPHPTPPPLQASGLGAQDGQLYSHTNPRGFSTAPSRNSPLRCPTPTPLACRPSGCRRAANWTFMASCSPQPGRAWPRWVPLPWTGLSRCSVGCADQPASVPPPAPASPASQPLSLTARLPLLPAPRPPTPEPRLSSCKTLYRAGRRASRWWSPQPSGRTSRWVGGACHPVLCACRPVLGACRRPGGRTVHAPAGGQQPSACLPPPVSVHRAHRCPGKCCARAGEPSEVVTVSSSAAQALAAMPGSLLLVLRRRTRTRWSPFLVCPPMAAPCT